MVIANLLLPPSLPCPPVSRCGGNNVTVPPFVCILVGDSLCIQFVSSTDTMPALHVLLGSLNCRFGGVFPIDHLDCIFLL